MEDNLRKFKLLESDIKENINNSTERRKSNKSKSFRIYIWIAIISAIVSILVAIGDSIPFMISNHYGLSKFIIKTVTLILTGTTTVLAAWDSFYNHKQLWINYGESASHLKNLLFRITILSDSEKKDGDLFNEYLKEYQETLVTGKTKWKNLRQDDKLKPFK